MIARWRGDKHRWSDVALSPFLSGSTAAAEREENMSRRALRAPAQLFRGAVVLLIFAGCFAIFVPFAPSFPSGGLDDGWVFGLNAAAAKGLVFGRDVVFTFGPYASAYTRQYHPLTDTRMLWSASLIALAYAGGLTILARDRYKLSGLFIVAFLGLISADPRFYGLSLIFILIVCRVAMPETHPARLPTTVLVRCGLALLVTALSLVPLIKGSLGISSISVSALACLLLMIRGRRVLAMSGAVIFGVGLVAFWILAGQPLSQLPNFFVTQGQIISGFADAMSLGHPSREPIIYGIGCCLLALFYFRIFRRSGLAGMALAAGFALVLFMAFKAGFVRDDGHALMAAGVLGLAGWVLLIGLPARISSILALAACLTGWGMIDRDYSHMNVWTIPDRIMSPFIEAADGLTVRLEEPNALREKFDESLDAIRTANPLPSLIGSTDIYSVGQSNLLANGLEWAPRPVLQSYSAYTPTLLEADAAFLAGPKTPDNVVFAIEPIDGRLPALEDGLSWPALLTRYEAVATVGEGAVILRHRPQPTIGQVLRERALHSGVYRFDEDIALPPSVPLWAKLRIEPNLFGKAIGLAFRLPQLQIDFHMTDGSVNRFRYIAGMGETGFVVSPLVQTTDDFLALESRNRAEYFAQSRPQSISISVVGGKIARWLWSDQLFVQLFEMDIPAQPQAGVLRHGPSFADEPINSQAANAPETKDCRIDHVNNHSPDEMPISIRNSLRVDGWAALSIKDGVAPDQTKIILTGKKGDVHSIIAKTRPRPDVNKIFGSPDLGDVGFVAFADISKFSGDYVLGVQVSAQGETRDCAERQSLSITALKLDNE